MGIVLSKTAPADCAQRAADAHSRSGKPVEGEERHLESRRSDAGDVMLKSQIRRTIELKRALEEKEKVIRELHSEAELRREKLEELDRTLTQARAAWGKERHALREELRALQSEDEAVLKSPLQFFRKVWQQRTNKRRDESG